MNYSAKSLESIITHPHYVRCNGQIPNLDNDHFVTITDAKGTKKWDMFSLRRFPIKTFCVCMECAGNSRNKLPYTTEGLQWDNKAVSNAPWGGVLLNDVIYKVPPDAQEFVFTSKDEEFSRSLPVSVLKEKPILLAYQMHYQNLKPEYGAPIRLIVPGWYGMASVKWLDQIYFVNKPFEGKYQTEKYTYKDKDKKIPVTVMVPKSLITSVEVQNPIVIKGKAWSGHPIEKVEVGIEGDWVEAEIVGRTGEYGWVTWQKHMVLNGKYKISSRATDKSGATQPDEFSYNEYGYGNNAIQYLEITV